VADRRQDFTLRKLGKRSVLKNYIKIAIRTIVRHKGCFFINVVGLAIDMTCCLLILMWVMDELKELEKIVVREINVFVLKKLIKKQLSV
jgi:hypothetical protein